MKPLVVVGDLLLDRDLDGAVDRLCPDAPVPVVDQPVARARPGGAGLAALLAARCARPVTLVTAVGSDEPGAEARQLLGEGGVEVVDLGLDGPTPEKVRIRAAGRPLLRVDYGGASTVGAPTAAVRAALAGAAAILVSDYGRGITAHADIRRLLATCARRKAVVWDPHPHGAAPVPRVRLATPNSSEAASFADDLLDPSLRGLAAATARGRALLQRWEAAGVVITLGARGALLVGVDGTPLAVPAPTVAGGDACGAGDCFAATAAACLADGALPSEAVTAAVQEAARFVAAGGAGAVGGVGAVGAAGNHGDGRQRAQAGSDAFVLAEQVKAQGGTVVGTGGCFDLLHAGHVRMLEAARALGDCLIVCLNSDASVRRLKGPSRPLTPAADRASVLLGLGCVDAVAVFDEDTPEAVLERLRPQIWAKGADYAVADLPEAALVASWGGQAVVLPYLDGRSTTRLIEEAARREITRP